MAAPFEAKICAPGDLASRLAQLARPLVFTNGVFDILHRGHATYLAQARERGAALLVALNSDASVRRLGKGDDRPVNMLEDRLAVIAALESVDRNLENAARTLGASEGRIFVRITLPLAQRSILAATAFAFARALGDFGVTIMIAGNIPGQTQTMAVAIYDAVQAGRNGPALVMVLIISAFTLLILFLTNRLQGEVSH